MTSEEEWQEAVGRSWAAMYRQTDRSFAGLTTQLLEQIAPLPGRHIVDLGCGAGELSLALAAARPDVRIAGIDISPELIEVAQRRAAALPNVEFLVANAASWHREDFAPDLLVSRHGVMFFDDPSAAFAHLRAIAATGARLVFTCFRASTENPWATELARLLPAESGAPKLDSPAPGPFAFARPKRVRDILEAAGWRDIAFEPCDYTYIAGEGDDPVGDAEAFFSRIGPAAAAMRRLPVGERAELQAKLHSWLETHRSDNRVTFPAAAWIVSARNG